MVDRSEPAVPSDTDELTSSETVPTLIARVYDEASQPFRVKLLSLLLRPVGPLALAAIASGAFAPFLRLRTWAAPDLSSDDAVRISGEHILELARYVEQADPDLIAQVGALVLSDFSSVGALAGAVLLHALRMRGRTGSPKGSG